VQLTPELADVLTPHLQGVRAAGHRTDSDAYLRPNVHGGRITRQRVGKILREAAALASERLEQQGRPPLPNTTRHAPPDVHLYRAARR
jgi:hypothetical protein